MDDEKIKELLESLKDEAIKIAESLFNDLKKEAKTDALKLIKELEEDVKIWAAEFASGELSKADLEFLLLARKELIEMNALKLAGQAKIKTDELKNKLFTLVKDTIIKFI